MTAVQLPYTNFFAPVMMLIGLTTILVALMFITAHHLLAQRNTVNRILLLITFPLTHMPTLRTNEFDRLITFIVIMQSLAHGSAKMLFARH